MRQMLLTLVVMLGLAGPSLADDAARAVISAQIEAFLAEDAEQAFGFASPVIQQKFGTPERFGAMVREGYPMIWSPADLAFLKAERIDGTLWQGVSIIDRRGQGWIVDYEMIESATGWRINGVHVRPAPDTGA